MCKNLAKIDQRNLRPIDKDFETNENLDIPKKELLACLNPIMESLKLMSKDAEKAEIYDSFTSYLDGHARHIGEYVWKLFRLILSKNNVYNLQGVEFDAWVGAYIKETLSYEFITNYKGLTNSQADKIQKKMRISKEFNLKFKNTLTQNKQLKTQKSEDIQTIETLKRDLEKSVNSNRQVNEQYEAVLAQLTQKNTELEQLNQDLNLSTQNHNSVTDDLNRHKRELNKLETIRNTLVTEKE